MLVGRGILFKKIRAFYRDFFISLGLLATMCLKQQQPIDANRCFGDLRILRSKRRTQVILTLFSQCDSAQRRKALVCRAGIQQT